MEGRRLSEGAVARTMLGFAGMDDRGLREWNCYEQYLHGEKRAVVLQRDALGRAVFPRGSTRKARRRGIARTRRSTKSLVYRGEGAGRGGELANAKSGTLIAMIRNRSGAGDGGESTVRSEHGRCPDRWRNRALTDTYEPGSTMKSVIAAAGTRRKGHDARQHDLRRKRTIRDRQHGDSRP